MIFSKFSPKKIEYKYLVALIYTCVLFLDRLDFTIVNITLPTLAKYFHVSISSTDWVVMSFLLALAISIPISAWLGDKFGAKKVFILSTAIFGLSSLFCALSHTIMILDFFRFLQGIAGGLIIPSGMTLVYRSFEPHEYASITSFTFLPSLLAPTISPMIGGIVTHLWGWQWVFLFAFPICLLAVMLSLKILKSDPASKSPPLDILGFIYSALGFSLFLYSISMIGKTGLNFISITFLLISNILIYLFIHHELKIKHHLIDLRIFNNKLFTQINFIQLTFQICHYGSIFLIGIYLQMGANISVMNSGLIMGMQAVGAICTSRYSVKLFNQYGATRPIVIGLMGVIIFSLLILSISSPHQFILAMIILFMRGIFSGLCGVPIQASSVIDIDKKDVNKANAIFNIGRQISISLGIALSSLLISYGYKINAHTTYQTFHYAFIMIPIVGLLGIITALMMDNCKILNKTKKLKKLKKLKKQFRFITYLCKNKPNGSSIFY